ncbi:PREDICTED: 31 kDa ribonucleoprotein, chloroplastic [Tarenaya hassleriana]|uniref:31 kDa ribonucleoprotein, chloroplastic n=1 Tax=Tarenaya hassleriana TaxID=28532 RepID=UPI00053C500E|nr:PREDICTED: 31 kDa ribonucleoprotein, chloroplastic [Tarenaya hassleriana]
MVLSNKKLKQKIREELAESLSAEAAGPVSKSDRNSQSQSLKELIDSASHKPRLSKREKRRKTQPSVGSDGSNTGIGEKEEVEVVGDAANGQRSQETDKKKKRKKRKRDDTGANELGEEGKGSVDKGADELNKNKTKEKKKTKKKKPKKKKKKTNETQKEAGESNAEKNVAKEEPKIEQIPVDTDCQADGVVPRKLYVGGIPYHYTEDEIRSYLRNCGVITNIDCKMRPEDGTFSGIAFVTFETEDAANRALALDRAAMGDRFLTIQQYVKTPSRRKSGFNPDMVDGYNRVYIGNLPWDTTERDIRKLFSDCVITSLRLGKNKETGEFKGYAHVDFKDNVSMAMALKLDQQIVRGRPVKISCAVPRKAGNADEVENAEETYGTDSIPEEAMAGEAYNAVFTSETATVSSGKIRRRTCYECGEKGHLSSACPKLQQNADPTEPDAT